MKKVRSTVSVTVAILFISFSLSAPVLAQSDPVRNVDTGETFITIQGAINDPNTLDNHSIEVNSSLYDCSQEPGPGGDWRPGEVLIVVDKALRIYSTGGPENTVIDAAGGYAQVVVVESSGVSLEGFTLTGAEDVFSEGWSKGLSVGNGYRNVTIKNNIVVKNGLDGIGVDEGTSNLVAENNVISNNGGHGILLYKVNESRIADNVLSNNGFDNETPNTYPDIGVYWSSSILITANEISCLGLHGIKLHNSRSSQVTNNEVTRGADVECVGCAGIQVDHSEEVSPGDAGSNTVSGNEVVNSAGAGIWVNSDGNMVLENYVHDCSTMGIGINFSTENEVSNNDVTGCSDGIFLKEADKTVVESNNLTKNDDTGVFLAGSDSCKVKSNTISNNAYSGIELNGACDNDIQDNLIDGNQKYGININPVYDDEDRLIKRSTDNLIVQNEITNTKMTDEFSAGVHIFKGKKNCIRDNVFRDNHKFGIELYQTDSGEITGNTITGTILPEGVEWGGHGIEVAESDGNLVDNNEVINNEGIGVVLNGSRNNTVSNNLLKNSREWGLNIHSYYEDDGELAQSKNNRVVNNVVNNVDKPETGGMVLGSTVDNEVANNEVYNSEVGITVARSIDAPGNGNLIKNNLVYDNSYRGISLSGVDDNVVLENEVYGTQISGEGFVRGIGVASYNATGDLNKRNLVKSNYIHDNALGMFATESTEMEIVDNRIENNDTGQLSAIAILSFTDTKRLYHVAELTGGGGLVFNGSDSLIADNTLKGNGIGIQLLGGNPPYTANNNRIEDNVIEGNNSGGVIIELVKLENNEDSRSTTTPGFLWFHDYPARKGLRSNPRSWRITETLKVAEVGSFGLDLSSSLENYVAGNRVGNNGDIGIRLGGFSFPNYGLTGESYKNKFTGNEVLANNFGVEISNQARDNEFVNNQIAENDTGIHTLTATGNVFHQNYIEHNSNYGTMNEDSQSLDATNNWWGDPSGPYHSEKNPDGKGNKVSDNVRFEPWIESETVVVGAKNFTEQFLVGQMIKQILEASGYRVNLVTGLSSAELREKMISGELDISADYTGTAWMAYLGHSYDSSMGHDEIYAAVHSEDIEKNDLIWMDPIWNNNSYGFAVWPEFSETHDLDTLSDLAALYREKNGQIKTAVDGEFARRPDGLGNLEEAYDFTVDEDYLVTGTPGTALDALINNEVEVGMVFATDPQIAENDLVVLNDDKNFWPPYDLSFCLRKELLGKYPGIEGVLLELIKSFPGGAESWSPEKMSKTRYQWSYLNGRVAIDGISPKVVAAEYLQGAPGFYSMPYVVSRWDIVDGELNPDEDPKIDTDEILNAISWWSSEVEIPKTCGRTMNLPTLLGLIRYWVNSTPVE